MINPLNLGKNYKILAECSIKLNASSILPHLQLVQHLRVNERLRKFLPCVYGTFEQYLWAATSRHIFHIVFNWKCLIIVFSFLNFMNEYDGRKFVSKYLYKLSKYFSIISRNRSCLFSRWLMTCNYFLVEYMNLVIIFSAHHFRLTKCRSVYLKLLNNVLPQIRIWAFNWKSEITINH